VQVEKIADNELNSSCWQHLAAEGHSSRWWRGRRVAVRLCALIIYLECKNFCVCLKNIFSCRGPYRRGKLSVAFVCTANNSITQRPSMPKSGRKVRHLRCDSHTNFKVKGQGYRTRPINADTHPVPYLPNGKAYELQTCLVYRWRTTTRISHRLHDLQGQGHDVTWSVWAVSDQWPINGKRIVVVSPKLAGGYPMTHATLRTSLKVKRSKIKLTGWLTQTHKMCHISRTVTPKNFKVRVRMEDVDLIQRQAPWPQRLKVKITRSHGISDLCGSYYKICTWYSDEVSRRILPTIAVTSKVKGQDLKFASSVRLVSASS